MPQPSPALADILAGAPAPSGDGGGGTGPFHPEIASAPLVGIKPGTSPTAPESPASNRKHTASPETSAAPKTAGGVRGGPVSRAQTRKYTPKREGIDWEQVEAEYRSGVLSIRAISANHGMSTTRLRDRAKKYGWERDLSDAVRRQARGELLREDAATSHNAGIKADPHAQASIVKGAAATQVKVVREHRRDLAKLAAIQRRLFARLDTLTGAEDGEERIRSLGMLNEAAQITEALSRNANRIIPLERQAFSLDAKGGESPGVGVSAIEERTRRYMADRQKAGEVEKAKATERAIRAGKASGKVASIEDRMRATGDEQAESTG